MFGAVLVGDAEAYGSLLQIKQNDMPLPENPSVLILPNLADDSGSAMGVEALPERAVICSCFDVTKGDIKDAVSAGCTTMAALKKPPTPQPVVAVVLLLLNRFWIVS